MSTSALCRHYFPKRITAVIQFARSTSSLPPIKSEIIGPNLEVRQIQSDESLSRSRPMVVLIGWMMAKKRNLDKYGNLYLSKGFDVLSIQVPPSKILRPKQAQIIMQQVLDTLQDVKHQDKPVMVHGFSVGGYLYGEMLINLRDNAEQYAGIRDRMKGQIFDSPVDFEGVPRGFANVLGFNSFSKAAIKSCVEAYLKLFYDVSTKYYIRSSKAFRENELKLPSLMLYSRADPIGVDAVIENVAHNWAKKDIPVRLKCWDNTPHVSHFHRHPDEYVEAILSFLDEIGLSAPEMQQDKIIEQIPEQQKAKKRAS